jgi:hypothetical protein
LSGGTVQDTDAVGAELTGGTFFSAATAVVDIIDGIDTDTGAIGEARWTYALAGDTEFATSAFCTAASAIVYVFSQVNTKARTSGLSSGAREYA